MSFPNINEHQQSAYYFNQSLFRMVYLKCLFSLQSLPMRQILTLSHFTEETNEGQREKTGPKPQNWIRTKGPGGRAMDAAPPHLDTDWTSKIRKVSLFQNVEENHENQNQRFFLDSSPFRCGSFCTNPGNIAFQLVSCHGF